MEKDNHKLNNQGFSLIELLVAMAIAGVVTLMVSSLMMNASKWYSSESAKATLQNELQDVSEQLDKAIMEASNLTIKTDDDATYIYTGTLNASGTDWEVKNGRERVIIVTGTNIYLRSTIPSDITKQDNGYLISDKVNSFSINVNNIKTWPVGDAHTTAGYVTNPMSVNIDIELKMNKNVTRTSKDIAIRNKMTEFQINDKTTGIKQYSVINKSQVPKTS